VDRNREFYICSIPGALPPHTLEQCNFTSSFVLSIAALSRWLLLVHGSGTLKLTVMCWQLLSSGIIIVL